MAGANKSFKLEKIPTIIYACFVQHNFCEQHSVHINEEQVKTQLQLLKTNGAQSKNLADPIFACVKGEGKYLNIYILQHWFYIDQAL